MNSDELEDKERIELLIHIDAFIKDISSTNIVETSMLIDWLLDFRNCLDKPLTVAEIIPEESSLV